MHHNKYKLSYKQKSPDPRNYVYISSLAHNENNVTLSNPTKSIVCNKTSIPATYSIPANKLPSILDQGTVGDCVCNAASYAITSITTTVKPSRLCLYAMARILDDVQLSDDSGLNVVDAATTIQKYGVCQETAWPYIDAKFSVMPPLSVLKKCNTFASFTYYSVNQDLQSIKQALVTNGSPILFGINVYDSFMTNQVASTGIIPMPNTSKETLQGGHCLALVGFNDATQMFTVANSWGTGWGKKGYCYMPYQYLTDARLAMDLFYYKINASGFTLNNNITLAARPTFNQMKKHPLSLMKFY